MSITEVKKVNGMRGRILAPPKKENNMSDYEKFQLQWMLDHGHSLRELMEELQSLQYDDPEDSDRISTPIQELFQEWEQDRGFGSEIWPCEAEWTECEGKDSAD